MNLRVRQSIRYGPMQPSSCKSQLSIKVYESCHMSHEPGLEASNIKGNGQMSLPASVHVCRQLQTPSCDLNPSGVTLRCKLDQADAASWCQLEVHNSVGMPEEDNAFIRSADDDMFARCPAQLCSELSCRAKARRQGGRQHLCASCSPKWGIARMSWRPWMTNAGNGAVSMHAHSASERLWCQMACSWPFGCTQKSTEWHKCV